MLARERAQAAHELHDGLGHPLTPPALVTVTNDIPVELRPRVPRAPVGGEGGASAGFGLGGLSERAAELGGAVTAGRDDDSFRLALTLPPREIVALGRGRWPPWWPRA